MEMNEQADHVLAILARADDVGAAVRALTEDQILDLVELAQIGHEHMITEQIQAMARDQTEKVVAEIMAEHEAWKSEASGS